MDIIEEEVKEYWLVFENEVTWHEFRCDEHGNVLWDKCPYPDTAKRVFDFCKSHPEKWTLRNGEIVTVVSRRRYGVCKHCGHRVYLWPGYAPYMGMVECDECGQWYNIFGQAIKPPATWYDDRDDDLYGDLYNDWHDDSHKYWYEDIDTTTTN